MSNNDILAHTETVYVASYLPRGLPHIACDFTALATTSQRSEWLCDSDQACGSKIMAQLVRQALLKRAVARSYPYLSAGIWAPASWLAELVAEKNGLRHGSVSRHRVLPERHFMFRWGGSATV